MALEGRVLTVECPCAGTPHEADTITFRKVLGIRGGSEAVAATVDAVREHGDAINRFTLAERLAPIYLAHAVESWTFVDEGGSTIAVADGDAVLPFTVKYAITDAADTLFGEEVTRPLVEMIRSFSPAGPTETLTSRKRSSGRSPRSPSARSSQSVSAVTEP